MICSDDEAETVEDVVLTQMLFVTPQNIRWRRRVDLGVIVEAEAIEVT